MIKQNSIKEEEEGKVLVSPQTNAKQPKLLERGSSNDDTGVINIEEIDKKGFGYSKLFVFYS